MALTLSLFWVRLLMAGLRAWLLDLLLALFLSLAWLLSFAHHQDLVTIQEV